ncbi:DUF4468 domain-containing protein [Sphingobacterium sp.]|uniref:DUF4468 domain-containing protein n=1 Tax=Sphingobacterium sp. TaxID=341027 RepID=UPI0028B106DB|nr:DUF4468 domain-containing protein [Sphingobacterium sp.]
MKKFLLVFALFILSVKVYCQDPLNPPLIDGFVTYIETVPTKLNKEELHGNMITWIANILPSDKTSVDLDDKENGKFVVTFEITRSFQSVMMTRYADLKYFLQVDIKDQEFRYKLRLLDHYHKPTSETVPELIEIANGRMETNTNTRPYASKQVMFISKISNGLIESLKENIQYVEN